MLVRNIVFAFVGVGAFEYLTGPSQGLKIRGVAGMMCPRVEIANN